MCKQSRKKKIVLLCDALAENIMASAEILISVEDVAHGRRLD